MRFFTSAPYTVSELAQMWKLSPDDVIRMACAEKIPVNGLLRDVSITTVINHNKTKGLPPLEDFVKNLESDVRVVTQWPLKLHTFHLTQMLVDGFADVSRFQEKEKNITIQAEGEPAKVTTDDCIILGEHAQQLVEQYNIVQRDDPNDTKTRQQTVKQDKAPQERKKVNNLLKVIGGFVEITYLSDSSKAHRYWSGENPNISEITDSFLGSLAKAGFSDDGIKSRSLRDTIATSLEQIKGNK